MAIRDKLTEAESKSMPETAERDKRSDIQWTCSGHGKLSKTRFLLQDYLNTSKIIKTNVIFCLQFLRQSLHFVAQAVLYLLALLPWHPKSLDYRYVPPCLDEVNTVNSEVYGTWMLAQ